MATVEQFEKFCPNEEQVAETLSIVAKKKDFINANAPSGTTRSAARIETNIAHGVLAQFAVLDALSRYRTNEVEMYDLVRSDNFKERDPWDLRVKINEKWCFIEVRSSYIQAKCENVDDVLKCIHDQYNLIADYATSYKPGEEQKHIFFQVYWTHTQNEAEEFYKSGSLDGLCCYVVGWASAKRIQQNGTTTSLGQRGAMFKVLPINTISPCSMLQEQS
jgi:hypothetical protein